MSIGSFVIGIVVGIVVTKVGMAPFIEILEEFITEAIPVLLGSV